LYEYIQDIFEEIVEAFQPTLFHMGGDEVSISCWNTSASIRDWMSTRMGWGVEKSDFMKLWSHYQENAIAKLDNALSEHNLGQIPIIVWSSSLTEQPYLSQLLDKDRFIVQAWMNSTDEREKAQITALLENGYRVIMSNSDALYLVRFKALIFDKFHFKIILGLWCWVVG
jgi:hexosaminidase